SGRSTLTLPPSYPEFCAAMVSTITFVIRSAPSGSLSKLILNAAIISARCNPPVFELPKRLVTQTLPRLSTASPLPDQPALNDSTLLGSEAGKRMTESEPMFVIQMRSCWSIARWKGANSLQGFLRGSLLSLWQKNRTLVYLPGGDTPL